MKKRFCCSKLFALACICTTVLHAQMPGEFKAKFPGEEAVVLNHSVAYQLKIKDGQPYAESRSLEQIMYLSANAGAYLSKYNFYQSSFHKLTAYEAYTKTAEGKKIRVTDFKTDNSASAGIFYDDVKETSFDFPALSPGAVGNLELTEIHTDAHLLSPFYFSRGVPVAQSELKISFPREMSVKYVIKGLDKDKVRFTEETRRGEKIYTFSVKDLPADKRYPDAPDNSYYALHVIFYIEKYQDESGNTIRYLAGTDDLYKLNHGFLKDLNKQVSPELKQVVDSITRNLTTVEEKARHIYKWVQSNIKYVAFEDGMGGFVPRDANLVCTRRFGDCKDMSSILTVMLNTGGVPAYYTWIGTRHLPYSYIETPLPLVDNHMISTIRLNDEYLFLDGTDDNCVFGVPSEAIQGKEALVAINDTAYKILRVPVPPKEKNLLVDSTFLELTDDGIRGNIKLNLSGYYAMNMHSLLTHTNGKDQEKYFKTRFNRGSNKFRLDKFEIGDQSDFNQLSLSANFDLQGYARKISGEWYLNLNLFKHYEHEEIDYPKRKTPIEFAFLNRQQYVTVLKIPEGYTISSMPAGKTYKNNVWGFELKYEQKNNLLILTEQFDNDHLLLTPDKFQDWNKVLENLYPSYKETISLTKK